MSASGVFLWAKKSSSQCSRCNFGVPLELHLGSPKIQGFLHAKPALWCTANSTRNANSHLCSHRLSFVQQIRDSLTTDHQARCQFSLRPAKFWQHIFSQKSSRFLCKRIMGMQRHNIWGGVINANVYGEFAS